MGQIKVEKWTNAGDEGIIFHCPGCKINHTVKTTSKTYPGSCWYWNGSLDNPVLHPSVKVQYPANPGADEEDKEWRKERLCHSYVGCGGASPGEIRFLDDCTHELAGKIVNLPDW